MTTPTRSQLISALTDLADSLGILTGGSHELIGYGIEADRAQEIQDIAKAAFHEETNQQPSD